MWNTSLNAAMWFLSWSGVHTQSASVWDAVEGKLGIDHEIQHAILTKWSQKLYSRTCSHTCS